MEAHGNRGESTLAPVSPITNAGDLSNAERFQLHAHETTIERGLSTFVEVGEALLAIRKGRLYRLKHPTFEAYCDQRWGISRSRAYQLMEASEIVARLSTVVDILPDNESQVRELAKMRPEAIISGWATAVETAPDNKVTANHMAVVAGVFNDMLATGEIDPGDGVKIATSNILKSAITNEAYERMIRQQGHIKAGRAKKAHVANASGEFEWYTPPAIIEAARRTMGSIDCDPATSQIANERIQAKTIFTLENSGLDADAKWAGSVWLNPPYAHPLVEEFVNKLLDQYRAEITRQAVVLVNNATETLWFQELSRYAHAVCFHRSRVTFLNIAGETVNSPLQGQAIVYLGGNVRAFKRHFEPMGRILYVRETHDEA